MAVACVSYAFLMASSFPDAGYLCWVREADYPSLVVAFGGGGCSLENRVPMYLEDLQTCLICEMNLSHLNPFLEF